MDQVLRSVFPHTSCSLGTIVTEQQRLQASGGLGDPLPQTQNFFFPLAVPPTFGSITHNAPTKSIGSILEALHTIRLYCPFRAGLKAVLTSWPLAVSDVYRQTQNRSTPEGKLVNHTHHPECTQI